MLPYTAPAKIEKRIKYFCLRPQCSCDLPLCPPLSFVKQMLHIYSHFLAAVSSIPPSFYCDSEIGAEMVPSLSSSSSSSTKLPPYMPENRGFAMLLPMPYPK